MTTAALFLSPLYVGKLDFVASVGSADTLPLLQGGKFYQVTEPQLARDYTYGAWTFRNTQGSFFNLKNSGGGTVSIVYLGDSWVYQDQISNDLASRLQSRIGFGGIGYLTVAGYFTVAGTWTQNDGSTNAALLTGPDLYSKTTTDNATPASLSQAEIFTDAYVHYWEVPGGGSFDWQIDGGAWTTVSTAAASNTYSVLHIGSLAQGSHTLTIRKTPTDSNPITICGVDFQLVKTSGNQYGIRVHPIGHPGITAPQFAADTLLGQKLAQFGATAVVITLGTNDRQGGVSVADSSDALQNIVSQIRAASPNVDILFAPPSDNGISTTVPASSYASSQLDLARSLSAAWVDTYNVMGAYDPGGRFNSTGNHPSAMGGGVFAHAIYRAVMDATDHAIDSVAGAFGGSYPQVAAIGSSIPGLRIMSLGSGGQDWRLESGRNVAGSFDWFNATTQTVVMSLTAAGNLGLGTTSPSDQLTLDSTNGIISITGSGILGFRLLSTTAGSKDWRFECNRSATGSANFFNATDGNICLVIPPAPSTGGAATAGTSYTTNEQAMLQKAYDVLRAYGMLT